MNTSNIESGNFISIFPVSVVVVVVVVRFKCHSTQNCKNGFNRFRVTYYIHLCKTLSACRISLSMFDFHVIECVFGELETRMKKNRSTAIDSIDVVIEIVIFHYGMDAETWNLPQRKRKIALSSC